MFDILMQLREAPSRPGSDSYVQCEMRLSLYGLDRHETARAIEANTRCAIPVQLASARDTATETGVMSLPLQRSFDDGTAIEGGSTLPATDPTAPFPVLMIDDAVEPSDPLVRLLLFEGYSPHCTKLGLDGLRLARSEKFVAVVLDLHLPDVAGITILNELRYVAPRLPVIVVTGRYIGTDHEQVALGLGAACFLLKPLDATELATALRLAIENRREGSVPLVVKTIQPTTLQPSRPVTNVTSDHFLDMHSSALRGDRTATEEIARELIGPVTRYLRRRWIQVELDWISDAVVDAFLEYSNRPARFDPSRGVPLRFYIQHAARKNLLIELNLKGGGPVDIPRLRRSTFQLLRATSPLSTGRPGYQN